MWALGFLLESKQLSIAKKSICNQVILTAHVFSLSVYTIYIRPLELFSRFKIFFIISFVHFSCPPYCWWLFFSSARARLKIVICSNTRFKTSIDWFLQDLFRNDFFRFEMIFFLLPTWRWLYYIRWEEKNCIRADRTYEIVYYFYNLNI